MKEKQFKTTLMYTIQLVTQKKSKKRLNFVNTVLFKIMLLLTSLFYINCAQDLGLLFKESPPQMNFNMNSKCDVAICPTSANLYAGDTVTLDILGINPLANQIKWVVTNSPGGENWEPASQDAITENFTPFVIQKYNMQVSYELEGDPCVCNFDLNVQLKPTQFRVELTWDGEGDVDLHLNNPTMTNPLTDLWGSNNDCYHDNEKPTWGASLDVDNVDGYGPENIVLNKSIAPAGTYYIGVNNNDLADTRIATVKIYCGSNTPMVYNSHGLATDEFWVVGGIDPNTCNFNYINNYKIISD